MSASCRRVAYPNPSPSPSPHPSPSPNLSPNPSPNLALTLALRPLQPGDVVRPHEHPEHVDMSLTRDTTPAPGFNHHTKSLRRRKKEAFAAAEAARLEAGIEDAQKE